MEYQEQKSELGRGGAKLSTFRWDEADKNAPDTYAGKVSEDVFWERIDYFLEKVVPVAEEKKVRLACHPTILTLRQDIKESQGF